ncbi:MAG: zinc-ribbon domain-containing protein, partial [Rhodoferax sp.]|nr:zinc-ribbon domain-containing protein [Rhodoferax sp.]
VPTPRLVTDGVGQTDKTETAYCSECGALNLSGRKFCSQCGQAME